MTVCVSVDAYVSNQGIKWFSFLPWPDLYGQSVHSHGIAHVCKCLRVRYCKAASRPGCVLDVIDRSWKLNFQPIACTAASPETKSLCCKIMRFCLVIKPHVHGKWLPGQKTFVWCFALIWLVSFPLLNSQHLKCMNYDNWKSFWGVLLEETQPNLLLCVCVYPLQCEIIWWWMSWVKGLRNL